MREELLHAILSQPTAPFREGHVITAVTRALDEGGAPWWQDPDGNIVVGVRSLAEYKKLLAKPSKEPLRVYIAHMDHPGYIGERWLDDRRLAVKFLGGTPTAFTDGAPVWVSDREGWLVGGPGVDATATLQESKLVESGRTLESGVVEFATSPTRKPKPEDVFGGFRFRAPIWTEGDLIYTKAADDLVGVFAIVTLALEAAGARKAGKGKKKTTAKTYKTAPFVGLLTRGEEVGFIGTLAHLRRGYLARAKHRLLAVSIETSRTLPGADIGKGPVVRMGDKYTIFDAGALRVFTDLAERKLPGRHQRRVMEGGTCEGTAALTHGLPTVAISVPLGNYHNQGLEGGPDSRGPNGPSPEFIHRNDLNGLLDLCRALLEPALPWAAPWAIKHVEFKKLLVKNARLLKSRP